MEKRERSGLRRWACGCLIALVVTALVVTAAVGVLVVVGLIKLGEALEHDTSVSIHQKMVNDRVEFEVVLGKDVSGISQFTVKDTEGKEFWKLYGTGTVKPPRIIYGVVPSEPPDSWKQLEPSEGALPSDIRGKRIKVEVSTRLDTWFGVGHQSASAEFDIPK